MYSQKGFFNKLFDFSFSEFIAIRIIGLLYALCLGLAGLLAISTLLGAMQWGGMATLAALITVPLSFFLSVIGIRISLEALVSSIRTAENTKHIALSTKQMVELTEELLKQNNSKTQ